METNYELCYEMVASLIKTKYRPEIQSVYIAIKIQ